MKKRLVSLLCERRSYFYILLAFFCLLLPISFPFLYIKAAWCLVAVFVLPGYLLLSFVERRLQTNDDLFQRASSALAISLVLLLVPWVQVFLLGLDLWIAVATILAFDLLLLLYLLASRDPEPSTNSDSLQARIPLVLLLYVALFVLLTWLYGANVFGDAYSYMTILRNIYVGDISPQANIHAAWESAYPMYKNILAPLLMGYALCAKMARVDPNTVWAVVPAFWVVFLFAINYSLTQHLFKKRPISSISVLLSPLVLVYVPSMLGDSHATSVCILAPLMIYLALCYLLPARGGLPARFYLVLLGLLGFVLAAEHLQNLVYVLYSIGAFGFFTLVVDLAYRRRSPVFKRSLFAILSILLCASPYIIWTLFAVQSAQLDVASTLSIKIEQAGHFFLGPSSNLLIVHPKALLSGYTTYWLGFVAILSTLFLGKRCYRTPSGRFVFSNVLIVLFLGLNPILVPLMSRLLTAQAVYRIGEMLPVVSVLSFVLLRAYLVGRAWFKTDGSASCARGLMRKSTLIWLALVVLIGLAWARHTVHVSLSATNLKTVHIVYSPDGASPNWLDRQIRQRISAELENPPFPILEHPTRLNRILDARVIRFMEQSIPANSVFLTDQLAEFSLPAYTNQLAFVGRRAWPLGRDVCPRVLSGEVRLVRTTEMGQLTADRLAALCTILAPETDVATIQTLLQRYANDIDYILVTPSTAHLKSKLELIDDVQAIYDEDGFAIYRLGAH